MMKRLTDLVIQDIIIAIRNKFHFVIIALGIVIIILINFVIPKEVKLTPKEVIFDNTEGKKIEKYLLEHGADKKILYDSREALEKEVNNNDQSLGIVIDGTIDDAKVTIIHQGSESQEIINVLGATVEEVINEIKEVNNSKYEVKYLRNKTNPIPFNKNIVPLMLVTEAIMLGFLLISVMVFQEKEEGSIKAYRVTPSGALEYIVSKIVVNILLAVIYSFLIVIFTIGLSINYINLLTIIILASLLMTLLGLSISVFFKSLQEFLFVGVFILIIAGLPMASYLSPSFAPSFINLIPSYNVLFALREVLFSTGKSEFILSTNIMLLFQSSILLLISYVTVRRKLMKEGR